MLTGDSAGGQLALYEAVLNQSPELREIFNTQATNLNIKALLLTSPVAYMKNGGMYSVYTKPLWGKDYKQKATYNYMDMSEIIEYADNMPPRARPILRTVSGSNNKGTRLLSKSIAEIKNKYKSAQLLHFGIEIKYALSDTITKPTVSQKRETAGFYFIRFIPCFER